MNRFDRFIALFCVIVMLIVSVIGFNMMANASEADTIDSLKLEYLVMQNELDNSYNKLKELISLKDKEFPFLRSLKFNYQMNDERIKIVNIHKSLLDIHNRANAIRELLPYYQYGLNSNYDNTLNEIAGVARDKGIQEWKIPTLLGWLLHENPSLNHTRKGDSGRATGFCQCNNRFRKCEYERKAQLNQCVQWFGDYTWQSSSDSLLDDVRRGHNLRAGQWYNNRTIKQINLISY